MSSRSPTIGPARLRVCEPEVRGDFVSLGSERFYRIAHYDRMEPFFMSVVSASDHWMFVSSNGGLTAGRKNPDHALLPYYAEDRIHDDAEQTGPRTILRVLRDGGPALWEPFTSRYAGLYALSRSLYKSVFGSSVVFEEVNHDLGLAFRYRWSLSDRFGFVKHSRLENLGPAPVQVEFVDGIQNVLPAGLQEAFQSRFSVLGDAYKQNELEVTSGLATYALSSYPGDSPEPAEALRATVCWSTLPPDMPRLLSAARLDAFRRGGEVCAETRICGRRGAYFVSATATLDPEGGRDWLMVADVEQGPSRIADLRRVILRPDGGASEVLRDVEASDERLVRLLATADGLQSTADTLASARHVANTLFNVMRGGVFESGYAMDMPALNAFVRASNHAVWDRHGRFLEEMGDEVPLHDLLEAAASRDDPALLRLVEEYLPISFSRRHGDPSRPWNRFSINVRASDGSRILGYEGNWRDIFQNWEALCLSFPEYLGGVISKFVNTSTADGYNPYRVTHEGYDWEVPDPDEPWAHFGYWGDHQLAYLIKLLEASRDHHPSHLAGLLREARFVYADVPYDIKPYEDLLADPRDSLVFNTEREARIEARVDALGWDGRYLPDPAGEILRANLTEKLLVPLLAKLANFVPGAGFWMNTQRPEWNDANNALAGYGASMVTLQYARRYLAFCLELFQALGEGTVELHDEVAEWLRRTHAALEEHRALLASDAVDDGDRKSVLDQLGEAAGEYRSALYARGLAGSVRSVDGGDIREFLSTALAFMDHSIGLNWDEEGLHHAYNVLCIGDDGISVQRLYPMLEGQVSVLSSGALSASEANTVLDALRRSDLYRADQHTYMLYPDRRLPGFLEKNVVPPLLADRSELLGRLIADGNTDVVERDVDGRIHFNGSFRNVRDVHASLDRLRGEGYAALVERESGLVGEIFEKVFNHHSFTGRSGTFYGYEGLGCVYWHMVSKLLLAVQECATRAAKCDPAAFVELARHYYDIRAGLGFNKAPDVFGAFPTDPYSHTPGHAGAKQPGMTGQVKEELITRLGELGLRVREGRVHFDPVLLRRSEFFEGPQDFRYYDVHGGEQHLALEPDSLAFTYCQVPVVYRLGDEPAIALTEADGTVRRVEGGALDAATSAGLFRRSGSITRVDVTLRPRLEALG